MNLQIKLIEKIKKENPLIHCITNYVTVNDCANILLALGTSPIMSDEILEAEEATSKSSGLYINLGTVNQTTKQSMQKSIEVAQQFKIPVLLDPVGVGFTKFRTETATQLISSNKINVIRANLSEMKALAGQENKTKGVDSTHDYTNDFEEAVDFAKMFARKNKSIIVISGEKDIISDKNGSRIAIINNGHKMMKKITGSGCMLSALITAFISCCDSSLEFDSVCTAVMLMDLCGEKAFSRMTENDGNASFRNYLIDAVFNFKPEDLKKAVYEIR